MRTAGTKILSLALAVLLALGTLPQTVLAVGATPPEGAGGKIIAFEALSDSVANQTKPIGTALVELNLPVTLLVTVEVENPEELVRDSGEPAQEDIADDTNTDTPDGESDNGGSVSGNNASDPARDEENEGIPDEEESLPGTPSDAQQSNGNSDLLRIQSTTGSALALGNSGTQQTVSVAVLEWGSEPEYDPQTTGTYVFTPVLDEAWSLAEDVERPTITVEVEASSVSPVFRSMLASSGSTGVNLGISPALAGRASNPTDPNSSPQVSSPTLSESTTVWYGGYEWVVIGWDGEGVAPEVGMATLLFANANTTKPSSSQFHDSSNQYADSTLQAAMNDFYNNLPEKEQGAIATRSLSGNSGNFSYNTYGSGDIDVSSFNSAANDAGKVADKYIQRYRLAANNTFDWYAYDNMRKNGTVSSGESTAYTGTYDPDNVAGDDEDLTAEKFWPLSVAEASLLDESIRTYSANWWLRSPGNVDYYAAVVSNSGDVHADGGDVASTRAVRPAFHLNLASVLFASDVSGASAKSAATVGSGLIGASAPGTSLKFTMLDTSNLSLSASDSAITKAAGETVEIEYTGAVTGTDKYVSAVLTDGDDKVLYYGKLSQAASGTASFTVPGGLTAGSYTLKLFNEECNGDNKTDFASAPVEIPLTVEENGGGGISGAYSWMTVNQTQSNTTKVWYGADTHGNSDSTTWDPYQWYVIGLDGEGVASESGTITLFSIDGMGNDSFNSTNDAGNEYINSRLRKLLTEGSEGWRLTNIPERERALMISRELVGGSGNQGTEEYEDDRIAGADVSDAKLWPLSVNEANQLDNSVRQLGYDWWLRSPGYNDLRAAVVNDLGSVFAYGNNVHDSNAVRPAFKLNLSSVLFASDAEGGKSSATVGSNLIGASAPGTNVKFTVLDDAQTLSVLATMAQATQSGDSLQFTYANASIGTNQYVSCVLEQDGEVNYYGKLANSSGEASGTLSIPLTGVANGTYTLKIFSEQANEDYYTDFASTPITMTVNVTNNSGTVSDFDGTIDSTAPTISTITPANGATAVEPSGNIEITFSEAMNTAANVGTVSLNNGTITLTGGTWSTTTANTYIIGYSSLAYDTAYTITVTGFQDTAGNVMTDDSSHSFTTKAQPAGPDVSATILNLDLNGSATSTLTISLGQSGNQAAQASISVNTQNQDDISISPAALTDDGTVTVTGLRTVSGAGITVTFSGGDLASTTTVSVAVNVTDSTPPPATAHTVTVQNDGRGTGSASPSSATQGETVTLTATPASGSYYFSHWEVVSGGAIPSGNSFVMPDNDVTVKAHFGRYSSGGNDSGNDNTAPTVTIPPAAQPDWPTIGSASGKVAGTNTQRTFTITDSLVKSALEKAQAEAKAQNRTAYGIGAQLMLDTPATAGLTLTLERAALNRLVSAGAKQFEIEGAPISLTLDAKALAELQKQSTGNVTITIKPVTVEGVRNAYDISFSYVKNGKAVNITSLGTGTATLSIPCTPAKGEAAGGFYAVYVDGKGKLNRIADSSYDANSGSMIFSTNHFSVYGVGYTAPSAKLTDIKKHWAKESIDYVVGRGLLSGTSETTFAPDTAMTRGMLVTALGRLAGVDVNAYTTNSFTDVKADSTFRPYIEWAYKKGIVQGIGNSKFAPDRAVTREEIAVIFSNYAKATGYTLPVTRTTTTYADASSIGSIYKTAVTAMQQAGIMMGGTGGKFNPKASATRAEVSSMLHRYIKLTIDPATAQGWTKNDAGQYFYYKDGKALTGTQTISGVKYFFETTGILKTGWIKDNNGNWRFYSGNTMLVGFWDLGANGNNKTYYFDTYGNMVTGKWLQIDGKWYYFNADGSLARSTKIDGYEVDENGVRKTK